MCLSCILSKSRAYLSSCNGCKTLPLHVLKSQGLSVLRRCFLLQAFAKKAQEEEAMSRTLSQERIVDTEMTPIENDLDESYGWGQRAPSMGMWPEETRARVSNPEFPRSRVDYAGYGRRAAMEMGAEYGEPFRGPYPDGYAPGERGYAMSR